MLVNGRFPTKTFVDQHSSSQLIVDENTAITENRAAIRYQRTDSKNGSASTRQHGHDQFIGWINVNGDVLIDSASTKPFHMPIGLLQQIAHDKYRNVHEFYDEVLVWNRTGRPSQQSRLRHGEKTAIFVHDIIDYGVVQPVKESPQALYDATNGLKNYIVNTTFKQKYIHANWITRNGHKLVYDGFQDFRYGIGSKPWHEQGSTAGPALVSILPVQKAFSGMKFLKILDNFKTPSFSSVTSRGYNRAGTNGIKLTMMSQGLRTIEPASDALLQSVRNKGRLVNYALPGSDDLKYLDMMRANANVGGPNMKHILLRQNPTKVEVLEEFLHGTQWRRGIIQRMGVDGAEYHVKDFMIRHQKLLGISDGDVKILKEMIKK